VNQGPTAMSLGMRRWAIRSSTAGSNGHDDILSLGLRCRCHGARHRRGSHDVAAAAGFTPGVRVRGIAPGKRRPQAGCAGPLSRNDRFFVATVLCCL